MIAVVAAVAAVAAGIATGAGRSWIEIFLEDRLSGGLLREAIFVSPRHSAGRPVERQGGLPIARRRERFLKTTEGKRLLRQPIRDVLRMKGVIE